MRIAAFALAVAALVASVFLTAVSVAAGADAQPAAKKEKPKPPAPITAEEEAELLKFLRQHHAELAELLGHLQTSRPADYSRAVRDLWHARERLRQLEKADSQRYDMELQVWVLQSKIQLLVARLAMSDSEALRDELRRLLAEQYDLRVRGLQADRERWAERLKKLDEQLQRLGENRTATLEREFASLTSSSEKLKVKRRETSAAKAPAKPGPKSSSKPTGKPSAKPVE